jgi:multidrug efflux pump subunit AcrA (membrane-fusion protein)
VNRRAGGIGLAVAAIVGLALSLTSADGDAVPRGVGREPAAASTSPATSPASSSPPSALTSPSPSPFVASSGVGVQLNFSSPGVLTAVLVKVGDRVAKGQSLATVDSTAAQIAVTAAQANLDKAKRALAALTQGLTAQELAQLNLGEVQAAAAIVTAQQALSDAQAQSDQDVATQETQLNDAQQAVADTEAQASQDSTDTAQQVSSAESQLAADQAVAHPDPTKIAADTAAVTAAQENQESTALKDEQQVHEATASLTNVENNGATTALHDAQAIHQAQAAVGTQQAELAATKAADAVRTEPPRSTTLESASDDVTAAQTQLESAQLALAATTLRAPAIGVIAAINGLVGESVSGGGGAAAFMTLEEPGAP